ncbi:MAG: dienelactone hydrolase family protein [Deltaproteobacteria bacterium]|nr:dienelactone hydrolase family protein [Deltaproteobacteria bacterium]
MQTVGPDLTQPETFSTVITSGGVALTGDLTLPPDPHGIIVFAHGSGSGRLSPRNRYVADRLASARFATLLFDLLTRSEEDAERYTRHLRFDIGLLADRLVGALDWVANQDRIARLPIGLFGASTGAAAALIAATRVPVATVVSRGGRPDLADAALPRVRCPTLLIVGGDDPEVLELNLAAARAMTAATRIHIVPGAGHLFAEPGALDEVTTAATEWFNEHLTRRW